jgi:hypothetical protein
VDAFSSFLPVAFQPYKLPLEVGLIVVLMMMNLRGMKEVIKVLLPIFLGFVITHALLILYGVLEHAARIPTLVPQTVSETSVLANELGWAGAAALLLLAYSQGGGTYTGLEAVSNNVNVLAEPRVRTGKLTMLYMALSLAFTAGGIIVLYLLWDARPVEGKTLNAVVFGDIIASLGWQEWTTQAGLVIVLLLEAGLLFVAANTGFLGGPAVLSNMAADSWVPHKFRYLSTRLVTENGILLMGLAALGILVWTGGSVTLLVVLYSISVFLTFAVSLFGLCLFWVKRRGQPRWLARLALSTIGFVVCAGILAMLLVKRFDEGGWAAVVIIAVIVGVCIYIRHHYDWTKAQIRQIDEAFADTRFGSVVTPPPLDPNAPTACFLVGSSRGGGLHTLLRVFRLFPDHFRNFVFINARTVDSHSYGGKEAVETMRIEANATLAFFVDYCHSHGYAAKSYLAFGTDPIDEFDELCSRVEKEFPDTIFFTSRLLFANENWFIRLLHNQAAMVLQRRLHLAGRQIMVLPMKI